MFHGTDRKRLPSDRKRYNNGKQIASPWILMTWRSNVYTRTTTTIAADITNN